MRFIKFTVTALTTFILVGCGIHRDIGRPATLGVGGAAVGAGAGALVGTIISNGHIGLSAALGAGIGAATGIVAGLAVDHMERLEVERMEAEIASADLEIARRQAEIDALHQRALDGSQRGQPDKSDRRNLYEGPTIGRYGF